LYTCVLPELAHHPGTLLLIYLEVWNKKFNFFAMNGKLPVNITAVSISIISPGSRLAGYHFAS